MDSHVSKASEMAKNIENSFVKYVESFINTEVTQEQFALWMHRDKIKIF